MKRLIQQSMLGLYFAALIVDTGYRNTSNNQKKIGKHPIQLFTLALYVGALIVLTEHKNGAGVTDQEDSLEPLS